MNNPDNKIFIGGLAPMTTQETLINYFSQFGELTEAKLVMDKNTGQSKGYAFVWNFSLLKLNFPYLIPLDLFQRACGRSKSC